MQAGFFTTDITPPLCMEVAGDLFKQHVERIHDPLKVRAAVFEQDNVILAFVGVDTGEFSIPARLIATVRQAIEQRTGISASNIMIGASHTHSGGPLAGPWPDLFVDAPDLVQRVLRDFSIIPDPLYHEWVTRQIITAVCEAHRKREQVTLSVGSGTEDQVLFNRRFRMQNGRVYTHPGKGNPEIVAPAGPVDPEVGVLAAWRVDGRLLGCLVNYGCHCTVFGKDGVSADYVYYLERTIQGVFGGQAEIVFLQGASGDVTQVNNQSLREPEFGKKWSFYVGTRVGAEAVKVLATAVPGDIGPLAAATQVLRIKRRPPRAERVEHCRRIVEDGLAAGRHDAKWLFAKEILILDYLITKEPIVDVEVQALQVGPAVFLANPSEYFAESGLAVKQVSPFPHTFVVTLANGECGYVPPVAAFAPNGGGYETAMNSYTNLEIGAAQMIYDASVELARSLMPGSLPTWPQVEPQTQAWSYGALPPELD